MTVENKNVLEEVKTLLSVWQENKENKKACESFFKTENKINFIHKVNEKVLNCFLKAKDKNGFILIKDTDIFKIFLKPFYEKAGVFFVSKNDKLFLLYDDEKDLLNCLDYKTYAFNKIDENKRKEREKKEKLKKVKTGVKLDTLDKKTLEALLYQAREALKTKKD